MPDFGRTADPQDIFGSLELNGEGKFVAGKGNYQPSGTYRVVSRDGMYAFPIAHLDDVLLALTSPSSQQALVSVRSSWRGLSNVFQP